MGLTILDKKAPPGMVWVSDGSSKPPLCLPAPLPSLLAQANLQGRPVVHDGVRWVIGRDVVVLAATPRFAEPIDWSDEPPAVVTDQDLARMDANRPLPHIEQELLRQGYEREYAQRRAYEWASSPTWSRP